MFPAADGVYLLELELENVRCFKDRQVLRLHREDGAAARWTVILGENGTGKTTLLWSILAIVPGWDGSDFPYLMMEQMHPVDHVVTDPPTRQLCARWSSGARTSRSFRGLRSMSGAPSFTVRVAGYGAARRLRARAPTESIGAVETLVRADASLLNPEDWLLRMHYDALLAPEGPAERNLHRAIDAVVSLLPDVDKIELPTGSNGKVLKGHGDRIKFHTPYGVVPLSGLSLGYQTLLAWTIDLAARLIETYPDRDDPLTGPAIVLVDEIDLHLHPSWQRTLTSFLTERFPNVQFIATAHSPLVVQATEDANLVVLRREGDRVVIDNDPESVRGWRVDQILTSELFGLDSARPPREAALLAERASLLSQPTVDPASAHRVAEIDRELEGLPTADSREDREAMELIRRAAEALRQRGQP